MASTGPSRGAIDRYDGTTGAFIDHFVPPAGSTAARDMVFQRRLPLCRGSEYTNDVLRFDATTGAFVEVFVTAGSGGIDGPTA